MMKQKHFTILFLFVMAVATIIASCEQSTTTATSITLSKTTLSMEVGEKDTLKATIVPATATIQTVTWSTTDSTVVTVDQNGVITAIADGTARVWASAQDGTPVKTGCNVTVGEDEDDDEDVDSLDVDDEDSLAVDTID